MPILSIDKQYDDNSILTEAQLDAAFASITTLLNTTGLGADNIQDNSIGPNEIQTSAITNTKLATDAVSTTKIADNAVTKAKLATALQALLVPTGTVNHWTTASAPTGWLMCDGGEYSRTTYADLFALISDTYGVGNGTTTFNVPDLRGMVVRMPGGSSVMDGVNLRDPDSGSRVKITDWVTSYTGLGSVQKGGVESHSHQFNAFSAHGGAGANMVGQSSPTVVALASTGGNTGAVGETRMVSMYLNAIIKI
jgi:microcystin-dependent protein